MELPKALQNPMAPKLFRIALFTAGLSLAAYIPYRFVMQSHASGELYGLLFPWAMLLAIAGMAFALRPRMACDCSTPTRIGLGGLSIGWIAAGMLCAKGLTMAITSQPLLGLSATFQMSAQHLFLSASVLALMVDPVGMASWMSRGTATSASRLSTATGTTSSS